MPRPRSIPDERIFAAILRLLDEGGEKAVSFATVAEATGLAPPTLVQRYGSRDRMVKDARSSAWQSLEARTALAIDSTAQKGPQGLLKAIGPVNVLVLAANFRDAELALRAAAWRTVVEEALASRLGSGQKAKEAAAILFAVWQGQALWSRTSEGGFRLKDAIKRLT